MSEIAIGLSDRQFGTGFQASTVTKVTRRSRSGKTAKRKSGMSVASGF